MHLFLAFLFSVLSLLPLLAVATPTAHHELRARRVAVKFEQCETRALLIELNVGGKTPKADLIETLKVFPDYPGLVFTPARSEKTQVAFTASSFCEDSKCAREAGFNDIQVRLSRFEGVRLTCADDVPGQEQKQEEPSQDAPKSDDGGVTSGN